MTNYLYIPLGGNKKGELKTLRNLFIVFLASGIWHGAGWNFVIWGMLHGICILIHRIWKNTERKLPKLIGWFITINLVNIFWVFFRAENLKSAAKVIKEMTVVFRTFVAESSQGVFFSIIFLLFSIIIVFFFKNSVEKNMKLKKITMKVLKGMSNIPNFIQLLFNPMQLFNQIKNITEIVKENTNGLGNLENLIIFPSAILIVFFIKNSYEKMKNFRLKVIYNFEILFYVIFSVFSLTGISTFLYFNF